MVVIIVLISQFPALVYGNEKDSENIKTIQRIEKQDPTKLRVEKFNNKSEYIKGDINIKIDKDKSKISVKNRTSGRAFARWDWSGSFNEVYRKSGRSLSGSRYNSVFWQWGCHAYYAFPDSTWDLEIARPDVGYWPTVAKWCNPN